MRQFTVYAVYGIYHASTLKQTNKYKNIEEKLYKNSAAIWYNKSCTQKQLTPSTCMHDKYHRLHIQYTASWWWIYSKHAEASYWNKLRQKVQLLGSYYTNISWCMVHMSNWWPVFTNIWTNIWSKWNFNILTLLTFIMEARATNTLNMCWTNRPLFLINLLKMAPWCKMCSWHLIWIAFYDLFYCILISAFCWYKIRIVRICTVWIT